jgi:hypothetical protein
MPREAISKGANKPKAKLRNSLAMPTPKVQGASRASQRPGLSLNQAVGLDRPELKPLEKTFVFGEEGSPLL